jgi:hypothetical protein
MIRSRDIRESDWKLFRQLRVVALERLCARTLSEIQRICADESKSSHERYLEVCKVLKQRDLEVARAFDDVRRSTAVLQLGIICSYDLLTDAELAGFTDEVRERLAFLRTGRA